MLQTWRDSWFAEGSRLLYIVPPEFVSTVLPQVGCFRVTRQNEAARRRTLRVRRTEQWLLVG